MRGGGRERRWEGEGEGEEVVNREGRGRRREGEVYLVFEESIGSCFKKGLCSNHIPVLSCKVESRPSSAL